MPIETLLLFLGIFIASIAGVVFLRNKIFMRNESVKIFLSLCEIIDKNVKVTSKDMRELKGEYQGHKISIALMPLSHNPDIINISVYGQFPEQTGFLLGHPELGSGMILKQDHILVRLENIYMFEPSHLAETILGHLRQMVNTAKEVVGHAA